MFEIFNEVFFESDLVVYAIIVMVMAFLSAFFLVKKLNTNFIVCAVSVLVYIICSFIINAFDSSLLIAIFCLFIGGFAISVFVGFAIDTIIKLIKKNNG